MFNDKLDTILKDLGITSREFSEYMQCDRSYINRIRSGSRILTKNSRAAARMTQNLFEYLRQSRRLDRLCLVIGCPTNTNAKMLSYLFEEWMFDGDTTEVKKSRSPHAKTSKKKSDGFSEKFKAATALAGLSNIRLARLMNVDASLISRWRTGITMPQDETMRFLMCSELIKRIYTRDKLNALAKLMNISLGELTDIEKGTKLFVKWLFSEPTKENSLIESLLISLDSISFDGGLPILSFEEAADEAALNDTTAEYIGNSGLRMAVLRFLGNAVKNRVPELLLYSDLNMDWMTGDKGFLLKWFSLMSILLQQGTKVKIIHNIDRGPAEMTAAIKSWLPLYMSGNINSYYSRRPNGSRFSNTLFICPEQACIYSSCVTGHEDTAKYMYHTDKAAVSEYKDTYMQLMQECRELIQIKIFKNGAEYDTSIDEKNGVYLIQSSLSLGSMPKEIAEKISAGMDKADRDIFLSEWELHRRRFMTNIENGYFYEFIPLPSDEMLFDGRVKIDTVLENRFYTPEDYAAHISAVTKLIETYKNYSFIALPETLLSESRLIIGKKSIIINRLAAPKTDFVMTHPLMRTAFAVYAEDLMARYGTPKSTIIKKMSGYLM